MKCLVADNAAHARELLAFILGDLGHDVLEAGAMEDVVCLAILNLPDVIILDMGLAKDRGLEIIAAIRREASLRITPVIALIAALGEYTPACLQQVGCSSFLVKPVRPKALRSLIAGIVSARS